MMQLVLLYFSRYYTLRLKMFSLFFVFVFMYYLCENYYKPIIVQYCIANCVSWVPQPTLLDLWTSWTYKCALRTELVHMLGTYCEAPQTRGRSCRSIIKEPPPLGGRSQQLIGNSVFSNLGVLRISWCFCNSAILPWLPGEAWLWRHEMMRGWLTDTQPSLHYFSAWEPFAKRNWGRYF